MGRLAPRIYDLHPLLAGPIARWPEHLPRIAGMQFDWVYVNAFWEPGDSGSIYAVRDPFQLHPLVRGDSAGSADELTAALHARGRKPWARGDGRPDCAACGPRGEAVGRAAELVPARSEGLVAPVLANPDNARQPRVMADLAELDLGEPGRHRAQIDYFAGLACHYLDLGAAGFRCSSAYKVPPDALARLIARVRERHPGAVFLAAALGCPFDQVLALAGCGFDLIFDSSRWWDFHAPWFLEQREQLRRIAPTVAFPEDHNTPRLAEAFDLRGARRDRPALPRPLSACGRHRQWLLVPMGFEFGVRRRLDPVTSRPENWQAETTTPVIDLTGFISETNALKGRADVLEPSLATAPGHRTQRPRRWSAAARCRHAAGRRRGSPHSGQPRPGAPRRDRSRPVAHRDRREDLVLRRRHARRGAHGTYRQHAANPRAAGACGSFIGSVNSDERRCDCLAQGRPGTARASSLSIESRSRRLRPSSMAAVSRSSASSATC